MRTVSRQGRRIATLPLVQMIQAAADGAGHHVHVRRILVGLGRVEAALTQCEDVVARHQAPTEVQRLVVELSLTRAEVDELRRMVLEELARLGAQE